MYGSHRQLRATSNTADLNRRRFLCAAAAGVASLAAGLPAVALPDVVPVYDFNWQNVIIRNTRSAHKDTLYGAAAVKVGGSKVNSVTKYYGDWNNGSFAPYLNIAAVSVRNDPSLVVKWSLLLVNRGGKQDAGIAAKINNLAGELADAGADYILPGSGPFADEIVKELGLGSIIVPDCDGPVVGNETDNGQ